MHKKHNMIDSKKRIKILILLIGLLLWLIILGSVILSMREYTALIDSIDIHDILPYIATMSAAIGFTTMLYLNKNEKSHSSKIDNLLFYSEHLKENGENFKKKETDDNKEVSSSVPVLDDKDVDDENTANEIKHTFLASEERIKTEIQNLKRRATINLSLGVTLSCAALLVFFFLVYNEKPDEDYQKVFLHFAPRVGLVVFVELLAYFFLKLY